MSAAEFCVGAPYVRERGLCSPLLPDLHRIDRARHRIPDHLQCKWNTCQPRAHSNSSSSPSSSCCILEVSRLPFRFAAQLPHPRLAWHELLPPCAAAGHHRSGQEGFSGDDVDWSGGGHANSHMSDAEPASSLPLEEDPASQSALPAHTWDETHESFQVEVSPPPLTPGEIARSPEVEDLWTGGVRSAGQLDTEKEGEESLGQIHGSSSKYYAGVAADVETSLDLGQDRSTQVSQLELGLEASDAELEEARHLPNNGMLGDDVETTFATAGAAIAAAMPAPQGTSGSAMVHSGEAQGLVEGVRQKQVAQKEADYEGRGSGAPGVNGRRRKVWKRGNSKKQAAKFVSEGNFPEASAAQKVKHRLEVTRPLIRPAQSVAEESLKQPSLLAGGELVKVVAAGGTDQSAILEGEEVPGFGADEGKREMPQGGVEEVLPGVPKRALKEQVAELLSDTWQSSFAEVGTMVFLTIFPLLLGAAIYGALQLWLERMTAGMLHATPAPWWKAWMPAAGAAGAAGAFAGFAGLGLAKAAPLTAVTAAVVPKLEAMWRSFGGASLVAVYWRTLVFGKTLRAVEWDLTANGDAPDGAMRSITLRVASLRALKWRIAAANQLPGGADEVRQLAIWIPTAGDFFEPIKKATDLALLPDFGFVTWSKADASNLPMPARGGQRSRSKAPTAADQSAAARWQDVGPDEIIAMLRAITTSAKRSRGELRGAFAVARSKAGLDDEASAPAGVPDGGATGHADRKINDAERGSGGSPTLSDNSHSQHANWQTRVRRGAGGQSKAASDRARNCTPISSGYATAPPAGRQMADLPGLVISPEEEAELVRRVACKDPVLVALFRTFHDGDPDEFARHALCQLRFAQTCSGAGEGGKADGRERMGTRSRARVSVERAEKVVDSFEPRKGPIRKHSQ